MFVRNLLQAGDHVTIVPEGIRVTLQYNDKGMLESVYVGHGEDKQIHPEMLTPLLKSADVPSHITITKGTTFVYGALYTGELYKVEGLLHKTVQTHYLSKYVEDPNNFHFFAGYMFSYAMDMSTPLVMQRWMKQSNFNVLPSYIVPKGMNDGNFDKMLRLETYPFAYPRIMGYIRFRNGKFTFENTDVKQMVVKTIKKVVSPEGYINADITGHDIGVISASYSDVVNKNIHEGSVIHINDDNQILGCYNFKDQVTKSYSRTITCEFCGNVIEVPNHTGRFTCSDDHCVSVMYSRVNRMLSKFGLPLLELDRLREFAKECNNIISLPDILDMEEFADSKVEIDLSQLLDAVVPSSIISRQSDWVTFCSRCNNSKESALYYLNNPGRIIKELNLDPAIYRRLTAWLESPENVVDISGMFDNPKVEIKTTGKRFEGAPIFRGKSIYLTGKFTHGTFDDLKSILSSYSAIVYDKFNTGVDCVIIGGLHEGVDGKSIAKAKSFDIPIFEEEDFFNQYDIDTDIKNN